MKIPEQLLSHWSNNRNKGLSEKQIQEILIRENILLPEDFKELYRCANGNKDQDEDGFLFFSLNELITMELRFNLDKNHQHAHILVFVDYMLDCWWYGVKIHTDLSYEIGIIPYPDKFVRITNSLEEFIDLYLQDSSVLYEY